MSHSNVKIKNAANFLYWLSGLQPGKKTKKYTTKQNIEIRTDAVFIDIQRGVTILALTESVKTALGTTSKELVLKVNIPRVVCNYYDAPSDNYVPYEIPEITADAFPYKLSVDVENFVVHVDQHFVRANPKDTQIATKATARAQLSSEGTIHFDYDPGVASQKSLTKHALELLIQSLFTFLTPKRNAAFCDLATPL